MAEGHDTMYYSSGCLLITLSRCPHARVWILDKEGRQHLSTSGSGQHQTQHGNNTALLPSNCYHSPSVLLLRYCSADQPLRAFYSGLIPDTHTHTHTHAAEHVHTHTWMEIHMLTF